MERNQKKREPPTIPREVFFRKPPILLLRIYADKKAKITSLIRMVELAPSSISIMIRKFEELKIIRIIESEKERGKSCELTAKGKRLAKLLKLALMLLEDPEEFRKYEAEVDKINV